MPAGRALLVRTAGIVGPGSTCRLAVQTIVAAAADVQPAVTGLAPRQTEGAELDENKDGQRQTREKHNFRGAEQPSILTQRTACRPGMSVATARALQNCGGSQPPTLERYRRDRPRSGPPRFIRYEWQCVTWRALAKQRPD